MNENYLINEKKYRKLLYVTNKCVIQSIFQKNGKNKNEWKTKQTNIRLSNLN